MIRISRSDIVWNYLGLVLCSGVNLLLLPFAPVSYTHLDVYKRQEQDIQLIGLSALMTTTVKNMKDTISAIRGAGLNCKIMVGGAVLNEEYAEFVGADFYVKDGRESVELAQSIFR